MSNLPWTRIEFEELNSSFSFINKLITNVGETQQMLIKLLNRDGDGFAFGSKTLHGETPKFVLDQILDSNIHNIITLDTSTSQIDLNFNLNLNNTYKIINSLLPTQDGDLANKLYVDSLERIKSLNILSDTSGLNIINNTLIPNELVFKINLSNKLQNFSTLTTTGLVNKTGLDTFTTFAPSNTDGQVLVTSAGTFAWSNLSRVTSIGLTTNTNALSITGTPVSDSGNINVDVSNKLQNLSNLSGLGFITKTGTDTFTTFSPSNIDGQVLITTGGNFNWANFNRVTSIGLTTTSTGITISNTPITSSGNIDINLSSKLENLNNLNTLGLVVKDTTNTFYTTPIGTSGQFLGVNGTGQLAWQNVGTVTSVGITASSGLNVTGSPITGSGNIGLTLDTPLQNFNNLSTDGLIIKNGSNYLTSVIPSVSGQILQTTGTGVQWVTPTGGGNVSGTGSSNYTALAMWNNTSGTAIRDTGLYVSGSGYDTLTMQTLNTYGANINSIYPRSGSEVYIQGGSLTVGSNYVRVSSGRTLYCNNLYTNGDYSYIKSNSPILISGYYGETLSYGYLNSAGSTGTNYGYNYYSLLCNERVKASEFNATSSRTIKNIIARDEEIEEEALNLFKNIGYTKYQYKDTVKEGVGKYFGVIAEELAEVAPHFVNDNKMFVPNIYSKGTITTQGNNYIITLNSKLPNIIGSKLQIIQNNFDFNDPETHHNNTLEVDIISYSDKEIIISCDKELKEEIFVYGTYEDSPTVAKNKLFELSCVVLKSALKRIEQLENKVERLC